jgi:hypothetical protein
VKAGGGGFERVPGHVECPRCWRTVWFTGVSLQESGQPALLRMVCVGLAGQTGPFTHWPTAVSAQAPFWHAMVGDPEKLPLQVAVHVPPLGVASAQVGFHCPLGARPARGKPGHTELGMKQHRAACVSGCARALAARRMHCSAQLTACWRWGAHLGCMLQRQLSPTGHRDRTPPRVQASWCSLRQQQRVGAVAKRGRVRTLGNRRSATRIEAALPSSRHAGQGSTALPAASRQPISVYLGCRWQCNWHRLQRHCTR